MRSVRRSSSNWGSSPRRSDGASKSGRLRRKHIDWLFATEGLGVSLDEIARRAGVGPGTVHRHFPTKEALYLAVATDMLKELVAEAGAHCHGDPAALFTLLSRMMADGAENVAVKSALAAAEFDLRTAAPTAIQLLGVSR